MPDFFPWSSQKLLLALFLHFIFDTISSFIVLFGHCDFPSLLIAL